MSSGISTDINKYVKDHPIISASIILVICLALYNLLYASENFKPNYLDLVTKKSADKISALKSKLNPKFNPKSISDKPKNEFYRFDDPTVDPNIYAGVPQRPSLIAPIAPRFDGTGITGSPLLANATKPGLPMQASPTSPVGGSVDLSTLGSISAPIATGDLTSQQVSSMLANKIGSGSPAYQETFEIMPVPDMSYSAGVDPTDPQSFMYDRTIFSRLKRRYGNGVDFFRGDIDVTPEYRGWFDVQPPTDVDIVQGYFDRYIDIQQETAIKDATFNRSTPVEQLFKNSINPFGATNKIANSNI